MSDNSQPGSPIVSWKVPLINGETLQIDAIGGRTIIVVGANGAGKSALATWLSAHTPKDRRRRVLAQRRIWFQHSGPNISASGREQLGNNLEHWDTSSDSRFVDHAAGQRTDMALFDLLGKIGAEDHKIADLSQTDHLPFDEISKIVGARLFDTLNSVLDRAGLYVQVKMTDRQSFSAIHRSLGNEYPIAQMSDGERSALLLAAEVLVAPDRSAVLLDEPERHLHRSISAGLIEALIDARSDCAFVVLTHDLDLAADLSSHPGQAFVTLGAKWSSNDAVGWALEKVPISGAITEAARRGILGGRRRLLFVEGTDGSLDYSLYSVLFPAWTVVPCGSCEWVIRSVEGIRSTEGHHWLQAAGIVDGDGRSEQERQALIAKNVHPLKVVEVESLYYLPPVLAAVATSLSDLYGEEKEERVRTAKLSGLKALTRGDGLERMAVKIATDTATRVLAATVPTAVSGDEIQVKIPSTYGQIKRELETLHESSNYEGLVRMAIIRDSAFRAEIASVLGLRNYESYQKAARNSIAQRSELADELRREIAEYLVDSQFDSEPT